jgi:hypothetical protein
LLRAQHPATILAPMRIAHAGPDERRDAFFRVRGSKPAIASLFGGDGQSIAGIA